MSSVSLPYETDDTLALFRLSSTICASGAILHALRLSFALANPAPMPRDDGRPPLPLLVPPLPHQTAGMAHARATTAAPAVLAQPRRAGTHATLRAAPVRRPR